MVELEKPRELGNKVWHISSQKPCTSKASRPLSHKSHNSHQDIYIMAIVRQSGSHADGGGACDWPKSSQATTAKEKEAASRPPCKPCECSAAARSGRIALVSGHQQETRHFFFSHRPPVLWRTNRATTLRDNRHVQHHLQHPKLPPQNRLHRLHESPDYAIIPNPLLPVPVPPCLPTPRRARSRNPTQRTNLFTHTYNRRPQAPRHPGLAKRHVSRFCLQSSLDRLGRASSPAFANACAGAPLEQPPVAAAAALPIHDCRSPPDDHRFRYCLLATQRRRRQPDIFSPATT